MTAGYGHITAQEQYIIRVERVQKAIFVALGEYPKGERIGTESVGALRKGTFLDFDTFLHDHCHSEGIGSL